MAGIFEIRTDYIKKLDDEAARELVARLCRAELRRQGLPEAAVTWGGDQRARDGGVDVRVDCQSPLPSPEYIRTPVTALQVKAETFPPSKIEKEMAPNGKLRPAILDLAISRGTYVIASSQDDVSDESLSARRTAMSECLRKFGIGPAVQHDFCGSRQIADWVEQYPEIGNWLRDKIGIPLSGWQPYGPWAYNENSLDAEYLVDERAKIFMPGAEEGSTIEEAIAQLRKELQKTVSIRIVGLSGVGKTRLAQVIFDPRVCNEGNVPPAESVIYTDLADQPDPPPRALIESLKAQRSEAVVIVDNCGPDTHSRLTKLIKQPDSLLKLITIEYDIRDDLPEDTLCYRLEGSSPGVITQLLNTRYTLLSESDAERIASFSDGNARVAFALAATVETSGELSRLRNAELFRRLFHQKNEPNEELLRCAEAASLLYSFDGEDISANGEISILAEIAEVTPVAFNRNVAELKRRGLIQQRGQWRALLPHAIANALAARVLETLSSDVLLNRLVNGASIRPSRSFTRRLGFLHESVEAHTIACKMLSAGGRLVDLTNLTPPEIQMYSNIAPVAPEAAIQALERAIGDGTFVSTENRCRTDISRTARSLAYEPQWFDRAVSILKRYALAEPQGYNWEPAREMLKSLFYCHLSGTQASVEQRVAAARALLYSSVEQERELGVELLDAGLEAWHFSSHYTVEFGARRRDFGWRPCNQSDARHWYKEWIELATAVGKLDDALGRRARVILGESLRGLWGRVGLDVELVQCAEELRAIDGWPEGWLGVRRVLKWGLNGLTATSASQLRSLERKLAPSDLASEIRARVLARGSFTFDLEDEDDSEETRSPTSGKYQRAQQMAEALGVQASEEPGLLEELMSDLMAASGGGSQYSFGRGIGNSHTDKGTLLQAISTLIATAQSRDFNLIWVRGIVRGWYEVEPEAVQTFMDTALDHPVWSEWFVELQVQVELDERGFERLCQALDNGSCPTWQFRYLAIGRATDTLTVCQIIVLAEKIFERPDEGFYVAIDLLAMVIHCTDNKDDLYKTELSTSLLDLLRSLDWTRVKPDQNTIDYDLGIVFDYAIGSATSGSQILPILQKLLQSLDSGWIGYSDVRRTALKPFFIHFPRLSLYTVCTPDQDGLYERVRQLVSEGHSDRSETLLKNVPADMLIEWCEKSAEARYPFAASTCAFVVQSADDKSPSTISSTATQLLAAAPDKGVVLEQFIRRLRPSSWSGSLANILEKRMPLLDELNSDRDPVIAESIDQARELMFQEIEWERKREAAQEREHNLSFE